jgi:DNA-binding MarR family transcriptional regulator
MPERRPVPRPRPGKRAPFEALFTYRMGVLVKLADRATARVYQERTGLTLSEARAITIIAAKQPIGVQSLAGYGSLDKSQASRVAHSLSERGLVRKASHPSDGRATALSLTAAGRRTSRVLEEIGRARNREILAPLAAAERRQLAALMDRLIAALAGAPGAPDMPDDPDPHRMD